MEPIKFKIRCSAISQIMAPMGLTEKQAETLAKHGQRLAEHAQGKAKALTENMVNELTTLRNKRDNPELPEGAKTYCKQWLKEYLYKRRPEVKSKYIDKGNQTEEDGFTLMAVQLGLGMVYKNEQFHSNDYLCGTDDLFVDGTVYDNKSSYSLDTFPMFEKENPKDEYWQQMQGYAELRNCEKAVLCYTLNDATEDMILKAIKWIEDHAEIAKIVNNMVFTEPFFREMQGKYFFDAEFDFVEIPEEKRIKKFEFTRDRKFIESVKQRVEICNKYINSLL